MKLVKRSQLHMGAGSYKACSSVLLALLLSGSTYAGVHEAAAVKTKLNYANNVRVNVTGTVKDSKGEPLPGVSVKIKGTTTGTTTDINGIYRLNLPTGNETLVFSFLGFRTMEVAAKGQATINVSLQESSNELNEVVVVGYGTQKKAHLTGAVVEIKAEEIENIPGTNVGAALAGRLLGVGVSGGISRPGSKATLTVRNPIRSYSKDAGTQSPLYVIDGVVQVDAQNQPDATFFNNLDQSEIESISVLKDAAAAVYGVRGANGVILITTKKGKTGKPRISYNGSYALNDEAYRTKMMSAYQFGLYMNTMNGPNGQPATAGPTYKNFIFSDDELAHFKNINYDWLDDAWKASYNTRHTLSISGGSDKATYFGSVGYNKQNGNLGTLDYNKWNFRAGTDAQVASNVRVGIQVSGNNDNLIKTFNKVSGEGVEDDYKNLLLAPRYVPMYINGLPVKLPGRTNDLSMYHYYEIQRLGNLSDARAKNYSVNLSAEYSVPYLKGLKAKASYGKFTTNSITSQVGTKYKSYQFTGLGTNEHIYDGATTYSEITVSNGNRLYFSNINSSNTQINFTLSYDKKIGPHSISGLFSVEKGEAEGEQEDVYKSDPIQSTNGQFNTATGAIDGRTFAYESGTLGYVGRVNYRYEEKYLAEFLFRTDASTKFAPENYWGKFYAASLGWVMSEEDFFKVPGIDFLKLRYSAGFLGNDQFRAWLWRQRYTFQEGKGGVFGGDMNTTIGLKMEASPNRDAHWSKEYKNNFGVDAKFLDSRLSTTVEGYYNFGSDILVERIGNVPVTVGGSVAPEKFAKVNQFGYEIELGWNDKIGKDFKYGINTRFNWYDNKVKRMDYNAVSTKYPWNPKVGGSEDVGMWGYDYMGMFKTQQDIDNYYAQYPVKQVFDQVITTKDNLKPGMLYYRDVRGPLQADGTFAGPDGIIDANDQIQLSKKKNNHYGFGITLKAGYKGLNFESVIAGSFGGWSEIEERNKLNNDISRNFSSLPVIWGNVYDPVLNPRGTMPNPHYQSIYNVPSNFWKVSAFRMRMTSFNLSYSIPQKWTDKMKINRASVYLSGLNPLNFYNPFDYKDSQTAWDSYPNLKTYSFGVNLSL